MARNRSLKKRNLLLLNGDLARVLAERDPSRDPGIEDLVQGRVIGDLGRALGVGNPHQDHEKKEIGGLLPELEAEIVQRGRGRYHLLKAICIKENIRLLLRQMPTQIKKAKHSFKIFAS